MPQSEKLKLKAELETGEKQYVEPQLADTKALVRQLHEAYLKHFPMNKAKARGFLTGKTSTPVSSPLLHTYFNTCKSVAVCLIQALATQSTHFSQISL